MKQHSRTLTVARDSCGVQPSYGSDYGAKYPKISSTRWVGLVTNALMEPLLVGTTAMLPVMVPSVSFRLATTGCVVPCGHRVR